MAGLLGGGRRPAPLPAPPPPSPSSSSSSPVVHPDPASFANSIIINQHIGLHMPYYASLLIKSKERKKSFCAFEHTIHFLWVILNFPNLTLLGILWPRLSIRALNTISSIGYLQKWIQRKVSSGGRQPPTAQHQCMTSCYTRNHPEQNVRPGYRKTISGNV